MRSPCLGDSPHEVRRPRLVDLRLGEPVVRPQRRVHQVVVVHARSREVLETEQMAEFVCENLSQARIPEQLHDAHPERLRRLPTELCALKLVHDQQADAGTGSKLTGQSEKSLFVDLLAVPRRIDPLDAARTEGELDVRRQPDLVGEHKGPREAIAILGTSRTSRTRSIWVRLVRPTCTCRDTIRKLSM